MVSEAEKAQFFVILKKLSEAVGVSGHEFEVKKVVIEEISDVVDEWRVDSLGNIIALKKGRGNGPKIMISAHMDEIGLMVTHIDKRGLLRFTSVGSWNERILPGQRVIVCAGDVKVRGVIGAKPPHLMTPEEKKQVIEMKKLFIDIGAASSDEVEELGIKVGSIAVLDREVVRLGGTDRVTGKAFDDRVGVASLIFALKLLSDVKHEAEVYSVFTVQEEIGLKGATVSAFAVKPDVGIAVDVTTANDIPEVDEKDWVTELGKGPAIKVMDKGNISHPKLRELLIKIAEEEKIPYQLEVLPGGATDAAAIMVSREGVPVATISIPCRYIHSPIEVLDLKDAVYASKLLAAFIKKLSKDHIKRFSML